MALINANPVVSPIQATDLYNVLLQNPLLLCRPGVFPVPYILLDWETQPFSLAYMTLLEKQEGATYLVEKHGDQPVSFSIGYVCYRPAGIAFTCTIYCCWDEAKEYAGALSLATHAAAHARLAVAACASNLSVYCAPEVISTFDKSRVCQESGLAHFKRTTLLLCEGNLH